MKARQRLVGSVEIAKEKKEAGWFPFAKSRGRRGCCGLCVSAVALVGAWCATSREAQLPAPGNIRL
jgi:hypothetical protein